MKYLLFIIAIVSIPSFPVEMRFRHIQDGEGRILATIDTKDGSVDFKEDPKKAIPVLIDVIDTLAAELNKAKSPPAPKKK